MNQIVFPRPLNADFREAARGLGVTVNAALNEWLSPRKFASFLSLRRLSKRVTTIFGRITKTRQIA